MSFILLKLIGLVIPLRATADDEAVGLDISNHGEEAYVHGEASGTMMCRTRARRKPFRHSDRSSHELVTAVITAE